MPFKPMVLFSTSPPLRDERRTIQFRPSRGRGSKMLSEAQEAQRDLSREIDKEAARLIREEGIPLYDAIDQAQKSIRRKRTGCPGFGR